MPEREPSILREAPAGADDEASTSEPGEPDAGTTAAAGDDASERAASERDASERDDSDDASERDDSDDASERDNSDDASERDDSDDASERDDSDDASERDDGDDAGDRDGAGGEPVRHAAARPARDTATVRRGATQAPVFYVAGFWRRLVAAAMDMAIILPVSLILGWIAGAITGVHLPPSRHRGIDFWLDLLLASDPALLGIVGLALAVGAIYALVFQVILARTPGMRIMKIRIIDQYGDVLTTGRATARTAGYLAAVATLGLGFIWIGFDSEKRGLHDWLSGTYVVKA